LSAGTVAGGRVVFIGLKPLAVTIIFVRRVMRHRYGFAFVLLFIPFFLNTACSTHHALGPPQDYNRLIELIQLNDKTQPLCVFNDFEEEFDKASHRATQRYFKEHPGLILRIKDQLEGGKLRWKLRNLKHRLLFVPENRIEYAVLYKNYCFDVIRAILDKTGFDNPYDSIQTLNQSQPVIHRDQEGVTAYIVHNLAKEYVGTYVFSNQTGKKVKIELNGQLYSGDVGAYTSTLLVNENGAIEFLKDRYTIWQNSAENPFTALTVPVEETLHIALREHTERAIGQTVAGLDRKNLKSVQRIVEDWIAVEEAVVGGIVYLLLPLILEDYQVELPVSWIEKDREIKIQYKKYRHLEKGISLVEKMGYKQAIRLYSKDPAAFKQLLL